MDINNRIRQFLKVQKITVQTFEASIGKTNGYLAHTKSPTAGVLESIVSVYPDLNLDWLITGKGDMLKENSQEVQCDESSIIRERLCELLKYAGFNPASLSINFSVQQKIDKQISGQEALSADVIYIVLEKIPAASAEWLLRGEGDMLKSKTPVSSTREGESIYKELFERKEIELAESQKRIEVLIADNAKLEQKLTVFTMKKTDAQEKENVSDAATELKPTGTDDL